MIPSKNLINDHLLVSAISQFTMNRLQRLNKRLVLGFIILTVLLLAGSFVTFVDLESVTSIRSSSALQLVELPAFAVSDDNSVFGFIQRIFFNEPAELMASVHCSDGDGNPVCYLPPSEAIPWYC